MGKKGNFRREYTQQLKAHTHFGESKHLAKQIALAHAKEQEEAYRPVRGIYSKTTLKTYEKACEQYSQFLREHHPEIKRFMDGKDFIPEWLKSLEERQLSAWTINTYGSGVACAYGITREDIAGYDFPKRLRKNITRSRHPVSYHDSDPRYDNARLFAKATGARRCGMLRVRKNDIRKRDDGTYEVFFREKNNMSGWRQVLPEYQDEVLRIFRESTGYKTPDGEIRLFRKNALPDELHSCRAQYACELYQYYEEEKKYGTGEKYYCRGDMAGIVLDKGILAKVSEQMFHHRLDVIVTNYLYGLKG